MTPSEVLKEVHKIEDLHGDYEAQHATEDVLYERVLKAIALGECEDSASCALYALSSKKIKFVRRCA